MFIIGVACDCEVIVYNNWTWCLY